MTKNGSMSIEELGVSINLDVTENLGSCISHEDFVERQFQTFKAHELLKSEVQDFLKKLEPFIELLEENQKSIDENYTRTKKTTVAGSAVSALGGGLAIVGTAAAPPTLGGTLALTAVGGALIVTGTTASVYSQYKGSKERKGYLKLCIEEARELEQERDELKRLHDDYIQQCVLLGEAVKIFLTANTSFQINPSTLKHILTGMHNTSCRAVSTTAIVKVAAITPGVVNTVHILGSSANSICKIVKTVGPSVAIAAKVTSHLGVALGSIGVLVDIVIGTMALVSLVNNTKCPESKALTHNIEKAKAVVKDIQAYYDYLAKEPEELFRQADNAVAYSQEQQVIEELKQENEKLKMVIGELEHNHRTAITELEQKNKILQAEMREQQLQFAQNISIEQEKQERQIQQMQQQIQQFLQQQIQLNSQQ